MTLAPAYVSSRWDVTSFRDPVTGITITTTPSLVATQPNLDAVVKAAAKAGVSLCLSPNASGTPRTGG